jgi:DNA repair protein RadC
MTASLLTTTTTTEKSGLSVWQCRRINVVYIPEYSVRLVRDMTVKASSKVADDPKAAVEILRNYLGEPDREHLVVMLVNSRNKVVGVNTASIGTVSASLVHPREVFKPAILASAAGIILAHNHPSGECDPSADDKESTRRMVRAGEIIGIAVIDHIIFSADSFYSFREHGLI